MSIGVRILKIGSNISKAYMLYSYSNIFFDRIQDWKYFSNNLVYICSLMTTVQADKGNINSCQHYAMTLDEEMQ